MDRGLVGADETAFAIVEALVEAGESGVTALADRLDLSKSTVHRHLGTLAALGYVTNEDGSYRLSHEWFRVGTAVRSRSPFYRASRPVIRRLAAETGETAWAAIAEDGRLMFVDGAGSNPTPNPDLLTGNWSSLATTAAGKAILAHLPRDRVDAVLARHAEPAVDRSGGVASADDAEGIDGPTDAERVRRDLERVRRRGYAINRGEDVSGIYAIGVPVRADDGVAGSLSVASTAATVIGERRESVVAALREAAERVESALGSTAVPKGRSGDEA